MKSNDIVPQQELAYVEANTGRLTPEPDAGASNQDEKSFPKHYLEQLLSMVKMVIQGSLTWVEIIHTIESWSTSNNWTYQLRDALIKEAQRMKKGTLDLQAQSGADDDETSTKQRQLTQSELDIAVELGKSNVYEQFNETLTKMGCFISEAEYGHSILNILACRWLDSGTIHYIYGGSSSGKSYPLDLAISLLPKGMDVGLPPNQEIVISVTSLSKQAVNYLGNIAHRIMYLGEVKPATEGKSDDDTQRWLRQLQSEDRAIRGIPEKVTLKSGTEEMQIRFYKTVGPVVQVGTTTKDPQDFCDENDNRTFWVRSDDSHKATTGAIDVQATKDETPWEHEGEKLKNEKEKWKLFFLSLCDAPIHMWFSKLIQPTADELHTTARRLYQQLKVYVLCSARLHQHQRQKITCPDGVERIVANWDDYINGYRLLTKNAPRPLEMISQRAVDAFEKLKPKLEKDKLYTRTDLTQLMAENTNTAKKRIAEWRNVGLLTLIEEKKGSAYQYKLGEGGEFTQQLGLVSPDSIEQWRLAEKWQELFPDLENPHGDCPDST